MLETVERMQTIRQVLEEVLPASPGTVECALDGLMEAVNPFEQAAREGLERFRETFAELAMTESRCLTAAEVRRLHAMQIREFGGSPGIRDAGLLESAVLHPHATALPLRRTEDSRRSGDRIRRRSERQPSVWERRGFSRDARVSAVARPVLLKASAREATERMRGLGSGRLSEADLSAWVRSRI
jgi:hypothetical protein